MVLLLMVAPEALGDAWGVAADDADGASDGATAAIRTRPRPPLTTSRRDASPGPLMGVSPDGDPLEEVVIGPSLGCRSGPADLAGPEGR
jgi:hypothetical protein